MKIFIDIDGTIATYDAEHNKRVLNEGLGLGLDDAQLSAISWQDFLMIPSFVEKFGGPSDSRRTMFLSNLPMMPDIIIGDLPIAGSVAALNLFHELGHEVLYATYRYRGVKQSASETSRAKYAGRIAQMEALNERLREATLFWLRKQGYPNPERVYFGGNKLARIADLLLVEPEADAVFIDDAPQIFLKDVQLLSPEQIEVLRTRCRFVVYGKHTELVEAFSSPFALTSLHTWEALDTLYEKGIFCYGKATTDTTSNSKP